MTKEVNNIKDTGELLDEYLTTRERLRKSHEIIGELSAELKMMRETVQGLRDLLAQQREE